jgi:hypothetical protein
MSRLKPRHRFRKINRALADDVLILQFPPNSVMKITLASSSPRRAEILRDAGISFEICAAHVDETMRPGESAQQMVARLAEAKARCGAAQLSAPISSVDRECIVIGADTAVELDGKIFGKPRDAAHAREMLAALMFLPEYSCCDCGTAQRAPQSKRPR